MGTVVTRQTFSRVCCYNCLAFKYHSRTARPTGGNTAASSSDYLWQLDFDILAIIHDLPCDLPCTSPGGISTTGHGASGLGGYQSMKKPIWLSLILDCLNIQGGPKIDTPFLYALTLPNINRFSELFITRIRRKLVVICLLSLKIPPCTPQVCIPCENQRFLDLVISHWCTAGFSASSSSKADTLNI